MSNPAPAADRNRAIAAAMIRRIYHLPDSVEFAASYIHVPDKATAELVQAKLPGQKKIYVGAFSPAMWEDES